MDKKRKNHVSFGLSLEKNPGFPAEKSILEWKNTRRMSYYMEQGIVPGM